MTEELEITIEMVCTELPGVGDKSLHLGIQRDKATTDAAPADSKQIVFRPALRARRNADGSVNFLGSFAHGPKAERFIYLTWATTDGKVPAAMVGRIKLHLNHIPWAAVEKAAGRDRPIRVQPCPHERQRHPVMASVRPDMAKWQLL
jgi:Family of unknown function (DUF5990)